MIAAPLPADEQFRLQVLHQSGLLDSPHDVALDALVHVVARTFHAPIALVSLVDGCRQQFKARFGLDTLETARECAFCSHVLWWPEQLVVLDAHRDERFCDNPLVLGGPQVRFYAGHPVRLRGACIGTLCLLDHRPRAAFGPAEVRALQGAAFAAEERLADMTRGRWD